jgi:hypothetical protein
MDILKMLAALEAGDVIAFARSIKGECDQFAEVTVADRTVIVARIGAVGIVVANPDTLATHEHEDIDSAIHCHDSKVAALQETAELANQLAWMMNSLQPLSVTVPDDASSLMTNPQ